MQRHVAMEYEEIKSLKKALNALRLDTSVDVPLGARRSLADDEPVRDLVDLTNSGTYLFPPANNDPDVWPSPVPADHSIITRQVAF